MHLKNWSVVKAGSGHNSEENISENKYCSIEGS